MCDHALESGFRQDREERLIKEKITEEQKKAKRPLFHDEVERIKRWFKTRSYQ